MILDGAQHLYYRGNYNRSRYCREADTEYVRLALAALVSSRPYAAPDAAKVAYGCPVHRVRPNQERRAGAL